MIFSPLNALLSSLFSLYYRFYVQMTPDIEDGSLLKFISTTISGFLDNDLMSSLQFFLQRAKGSFGLCVTSSVDAKRQVVLGSRGQTISIAFFPQEGMVLWGSEQSAVKAAMGAVPISESQDPNRQALRLDLDDLGGEVALIDFSSNAFQPTDTNDVSWNRKASPYVSVRENSMADRFVKRVTSLSPIVVKQIDVNMGPLQACTVCTYKQMSKGNDTSLRQRMIPLRDNPLIHQLPVFERDGVHQDIREITKEYNRISEDWIVFDLMRHSQINLHS